MKRESGKTRFVIDLPHKRYLTLIKREALVCKGEGSNPEVKYIIGADSQLNQWPIFAEKEQEKRFV